MARTISSNTRRTPVNANSRLLTSLSATARRQLLEILAKRRRNQAIINNQRARARRQLLLLRQSLIQRHRNKINQSIRRNRINSRSHFHHSRNNHNTFGSSDIGTADVFGHPSNTISNSFNHHATTNQFSNAGAVDPFANTGSVHSFQNTGTVAPFLGTGSTDTFNNAGSLDHLPAFIPVGSVDHGLVSPRVVVPQIAIVPSDLLVTRPPVQIIPAFTPTSPPVRQKTELDKAIELYLMDELGIDPPDPPETATVIKKTKPKRKPKQKTKKKSLRPTQTSRSTVILRTTGTRFSTVPTTPTPMLPTKPKVTISELARIAQVSTQTPIRIILTSNQKTTIPASLPTTPRPIPTVQERVIHNNDHLLITPGGNFTIQLANNTSNGQGFRITKR